MEMEHGRNLIVLKNTTSFTQNTLLSFLLCLLSSPLVILLILLILLMLLVLLPRYFSRPFAVPMPQLHDFYGHGR